MKDLLDGAIVVAVRFRYGYRGYETEDKACRALARRCRGFTKEQYATALSRAKTMYDAAEAVIWQNREALAASERDPESGLPPFADLIEPLQRQHSGFPEETHLIALRWAYYWRILR